MSAAPSGTLARKSKASAAPTRRGFRHCRKCDQNRALKFFAPRGRVCKPCQRGRGRLAARSVRLVEQYGITEADYAALLAAQGGACAICGGTRRKNLDVDHDHKLEGRASVRGLLCARCNRQILRHARDDAALLRAAASYIDNPPARSVLKGLDESQREPGVGRANARPTPVLLSPVR